MITGTLVFDVQVSGETEEVVGELSRAICSAVKAQPGVSSCEEVDSDLEDDADDD